MCVSVFICVGVRLYVCSYDCVYAQLVQVLFYSSENFKIICFFFSLRITSFESHITHARTHTHSDEGSSWECGTHTPQ